MPFDEIPENEVEGYPCDCGGSITRDGDMNKSGVKQKDLMDDRPFPIQGGHNWNRKPGDRPVIHYQPCIIPWWLAEEAYKVYSKKFGNAQSLERLAERGGFGREELLWLLSGNQIEIKM